MRTSTKLLLAIGVTAVIGSAALADAPPAAHHLLVPLPGGGAEQLSYTGGVAPQIVFLPDDSMVPMFMPTAGFLSLFAGLDRISAEENQIATFMDRQMTVATQELQSVPLAVGIDVTDTTPRSLPAGTESYSFVSTINGRKVCTREVQITGMGNHATPKVVSHSSGNCDGEQSLNQDSPDSARTLQTSTPVAVEISEHGPHI